METSETRPQQVTVNQWTDKAALKSTHFYLVLTNNDIKLSQCQNEERSNSVTSNHQLNSQCVRANTVEISLDGCLSFAHTLSIWKDKWNSIYWPPLCWSSVRNLRNGNLNSVSVYMTIYLKRWESGEPTLTCCTTAPNTEANPANIKYIQTDRLFPLQQMSHMSNLRDESVEKKQHINPTCLPSLHSMQTFFSISKNTRN